MLTRFSFFIITLLWGGVIFAQNGVRQQNTPNSEIIADAPYRIGKNDIEGNLNAIPVSIFVHDANCSGCNNELKSISISLKNAGDIEFDSALTFNEYSDSLYHSLFDFSSSADTALGIQEFKIEEVMASENVTIDFISDTNFWIPPVTYIDVVDRYFYFTFFIPGEKLLGYDDVIDIKVDFGLDWASDASAYMRVFRTESCLPTMEGWYKGDTHYHSMYTTNTVEIGLPLRQTKNAAQTVGLDWITITDHSCDFDNYGQGMQENWSHFQNSISEINSEDNRFVFIPGIEMSVNNSQGEIVHALTYPSSENTNSIPYLGDGGGDQSSTNVSIVGLLDSLDKYSGFCYAAHPFAQWDELSWTIDGGVWNLSDSIFPLSGEAHYSAGTVICNDTDAVSDIFVDRDSLLFHPALRGGQIWNVYNSLYGASNVINPWNAEYEDIDEFEQMLESNPENHRYRFLQNLDVTKAIWQKSLLIKNLNPEQSFCNFNIIAGSDAHGSFNYSNTDSYYEIMGSIHDNAIGKLSTYAYCPEGMGASGENVLAALKSGHVVLSSGPIISMSINTNQDDDVYDILPGDEAVLIDEDFTNSTLVINTATSEEFGDVVRVKLIVGTELGEFSTDLDINQCNYELNLNDIVNQVLNDNGLYEAKSVYLRAELSTLRFYDDVNIYKRSMDFFHTYTNPIWIRYENTLTAPDIPQFTFNAFPNPVSGNLNIAMAVIEEGNYTVSVIDNLGKTIYKNQLVLKRGLCNQLVDLSNANPGVYYLNILWTTGCQTKQVVVE